MPIWAASQGFHRRTIRRSSVMITPRSSISSNHLAAALPSASTFWPSAAISALRPFPRVDGMHQPIERSDAEHDDHVACHLRVAQTKTGMNDQRVADFLVRDLERLENRRDVLDAQMRHRERHLHLQQVAERAETGIEEDVTDLGDHLAGGGVDRQRQRRFAGQQLLQHRRTALVENQHRIAGDRTAENLMDAGDIARHHAAERFADLFDRLQRDLRHLEQHAMAGQLRQRRGGAAEPDVQQLDQRILLKRRQLDHARNSSVFATALNNAERSTGLLRNSAAPAAWARSRDESCKAADKTTTRASTSISVSLLRPSSPSMPFITRSSKTRSGRSRK